MFGPTFTDTISQSQPQNRIKLPVLSLSSSNLFWRIILTISMLVLLVRLVQLQVFAGDENRQLADEQRIRLVQIPAARGLITDRNGEIIAQNQPIFRQIIIDSQTGLHLQPIDRAKALQLEADGYSANLVEGVGRKYSAGPATAHLLGYIAEANADELADPQLNYQLGDMVGRGGIEAAFDQWLRGQNGARLVEVDTAGRFVRQAGTRQPTPGRRLQLSIDKQLQQSSYQLLEADQSIGSIVVSQAKTGEILAMASYPSYDPDLFNPLNARDHGDQIIDLFNHPDRALVNRSIAAVYPPGSTFKIITSVAALETGTIESDYTYKDTGVVRVGEYEYTNWYLTQHGGQEGIIDIRQALARSTDTFFYKVGELLGPQQLADWSRKFGLGQTTGLPLPEELAGLVPDPAWKLKTIGEPWYLGNTYHMSIGQGDLLTTPLQVNLLTSVIANQGQLCSPKLILTDIPSVGAGLVPAQAPGRAPEGWARSAATCTDLNISPTTLQLVTQGMVAACSPEGTAFPFFDYQPQVACKTGTAEFGPEDERGIRKTHAWLTAFAPVEDPQIIVTVLLEAGGEGSRDAAPVAKKVIEQYFQNQPLDQ